LKVHLVVTALSATFDQAETASVLKLPLAVMTSFITFGQAF
jgi:hypothetical protein